jgi:hypothetical protein
MRQTLEPFILRARCTKKAAGLPLVPPLLMEGVQKSVERKKSVGPPGGYGGAGA